MQIQHSYAYQRCKSQVDYQGTPMRLEKIQLDKTLQIQSRATIGYTAEIP